jgi:hypothetical protein
MPKAERGQSWPHRTAEFVRSTLFLWGITLAGFVWRVVTIVLVRPTCPMASFTAGQGFRTLELDPQPHCLTIGGDSLVHYLQGRFLAEGKGIISPIYWIELGTFSPGAAKPPIYSGFLGVLYALGIRDPTWQRIASALIGSLAIFLVGYTATLVVGSQAGRIAAVLVAASPTLWINDGALKNDGFVAPFVALVILLAYRVSQKPRPRTAVAFGAAVGFAALVRSEASFLLLFIGIPLFWGLRQLSARGRLKLWILAVTVGGAVMLPWIIRNMVSYTNPTFMSVGAGSVLLNGSCDDTYYGKNIGSLSFECFKGEGEQALLTSFDPRNPAEDESVVDKRLMDIALPYVKDHLGRLPIVMAARIGRIYQIYAPFETVRYDIAFEDRGDWESWSALWFHWMTVPLAICGAVIMRRRRLPLSPLVGVIVGVAFTAAVTFGITRYRGTADLAMCMLAAVALEWAWARIARKARPKRHHTGQSADDILLLRSRVERTLSETQPR